MRSPEDHEQISDEEYVREFLDSCVNVRSTSLIMTFGMQDKLDIALPPALLVARCPGFDFDGVPGMTADSARSSTNDYRWGLVRDDDDLWATCELFWSSKTEEIVRRLKINLKSSVRSFFTSLLEISTSEIATFGISDEPGGMPKNLLGVQIDVMDEMFRQIASYVHHQEVGDG